MRSPTQRETIERFLARLGDQVRGPGSIYLVGGATAVLYGWRASTIDIDLKVAVEPPGLFEAIAVLKDELDVNVAMASPDQFIPPLPGGQERSPFVGRYGPIEVFH